MSNASLILGSYASGATPPVNRPVLVDQYGHIIVAFDSNSGSVVLGAGTAHIGKVEVDTALPAGEAHIGAVGGNSALVTPTITVSTSPAYTAGDSIGGKITLANAVRVSGGTGILESIMVLDRANQKAAIDIIIFDADPSAATITDNAAFVFSTDDLKVLARIPVATTDYVTYNSKATANIKAIGALLKAASGTSLYAAVVTSGTPTFAATTDFQLRFGILQD